MITFLGGSVAGSSQNDQKPNLETIYPLFGVFLCKFWSWCIWLLHPPKFDMEPKNGTQEQEIPLEHIIFRLHVQLGV